MKLSEVYQEFIPAGSKSTVTADKLARDFLVIAREEAYKAGKPNNPAVIRKIVDQIVNNFTSSVLAAVDREVSMSKAKSI